MQLGAAVFTKSLLRQGSLRAKYDEAKLIAELKKVYGAKTAPASPATVGSVRSTIRRCCP